MKHSRRSFIMVATAAVVAAPTASRGQAPAIDVRSLITGAAFGFVGGDRERAAIRAGIERAIAQMNFLTRPIARTRLVDRNQPYSSVTMRFPPGFIEVVCTGRPVFRSPDNGTAASWRGPDGGDYRLIQRVDAETIVQEIGNMDGARRNVFRVSPDGRTLTLGARISSRHLSAPVEYTLTYRR